MVTRADRKRIGIMTAIALMLCVTAVGSPVSVLQAEEQTVSQVSEEPGQYTVPDGWSEDTSAETETGKIYRYSEKLEEEASSSVTCSYMTTNYMTTEYEQLRDMLTNDIVYSRVNAQISTNAAYTDNKDYLYILTADDASLDYREIFYYVVGDLKCFCAAVKEYRSEADEARSAQRSTPEEVGKQIAAGFTWK